MRISGRQRTPRQPDSAWSWLVLFSAIVCNGLTLGSAYSYGVLLPPFMEYFGQSRERTAWVGSLLQAMIMFSGPFTGGVINRFGCRVAAVIGGLLFAVGTCLSSFAESIEMLYFTYGILGGIGVNLVLMASMVSVAKYFKKRQSAAVAFASAGTGVGTMVISATLQALLDSLGWRSTLRVMSGVLLLTALLGCSFDPNIDDDGSDKPPRQPDRRLDCSTCMCRCIDWSVCKLPFVLVMAATSSVANFCRITPFVHLVKYSIDVGIPEEKAAHLFLFLGAFMAFGRLSVTAILAFKKLDTMHLYQASMCIIGLSMLLIAAARTYTFFLIFAVVFGAFDGMHAALFQVQMMVCVSPSLRVSALGMVLLINVPFTAGGPPLSGFLADTLGSYEPAFYLSGGVAIVGSAIPFLLLCVKNGTAQNERSQENSELIAEVQIIEKETQV